MTRTILTTLLIASIPLILHAHGPGHIHERAAATPIVEDSHDHSGHDHDHSGKSHIFEEEVRWWGASLTTGWEGRHVHYGVDETGNYGAYTTELAIWAGDFIFSVWSGFGTGNDFQEWDFTAAYNFEIGPVFLIPGYNLRYNPEVHEDEHADHEEDDHDEEEHEEHEEHSHVHKTIGNELFFVLGTNAIPYVTPNAVFIWDLNNTPGAFMEIRLDGEIPIWKDIVSLQPYALLGLNFGYNTRDYYGWNNFQFGIQADWKINRVVTVFAGVNYNIAMTALQTIDQGNVFWANVGVTFTY